MSYTPTKRADYPNQTGGQIQPNGRVNPTKRAALQTDWQSQLANHVWCDMPNDMSLTLLQKTNFDGFPKAGELIEVTGTHLLEASDRSLLNTLIQRAHDSGKLTDVDAEWELTFAELRQELSKHESNDRVRASLERLGSVRVVVHYHSNGKPRTLRTPLLAFTDTDDEDAANATVQYGIPKRLRLILARSNRWGRVRCEVAYAMKCKYAIALYELVCLRLNRESCVDVFTLERFRELLGVPPGTYEDGTNFRAKVIEPALLEVNGLSDFGVSIDLRRRHPRAPVHEVAVAWWKKQGDEYRAAIDERGRSKIGRKARLRGEVEAIANVSLE
jgi:hypothetical protein